jgi:hypothetical protein
MEIRNMGFCAKCGEKLMENARFCSICGAPVSPEQCHSADKNESNTEFVGKLHKCKNCGEILDSFSPNCPTCGCEIRDIDSSDAVREFLSSLKHASNDKEKIDIVRNFPIPNTKEDVWEFMIIVSSNVGSNTNRALSKAWETKIEQAYQKAQLILKDEAEFSRAQKLCSTVRMKLMKERQGQQLRSVQEVISQITPSLAGLFVTMGWLISIFILIPLCRLNLKNVDSDDFQMLIFIDFIAGAIFVPSACNDEYALPKQVCSFGLLLSIIVTIPLCMLDLYDNPYILILFIDIVCSAVILPRLHIARTQKDKNDNESSSVPFITCLVCLVILVAVYIIASKFVSVNGH